MAELARAELLAIHHAVMNPMEVTINDSDTYTVKRVKEIILAWHRTSGERTAESQAAIKSLKAALTDACTLLEGWINRYCVAKYRAEHLADLEKKRRVLDV